MQFILGLADDLIVLIIFIYLALVVSGTLKLREARWEKFNKLMERRGTLMKILIYGGLIIFALITAHSFFTMESSRAGKPSASIQPHRSWTNTDKDVMTKACITNAKNSYQRDPAGTTALCACITEKITSKYTFQQMEELGKKSQQEQIDSAMPFVKSCLNEMNPVH